MPETTEQYYEVMKAFKTGDPNGNGASDEFPFVASTHGSSNPNWFLNSFVYDTNNHLYIEGDQVYLSADKGAWREGVSWLQQMFADGLMDPESFSQDWDIMRQKGQREDAAVIGSFSSLAYFFVTGNDTGDTDERSDKYEVVPPLEGPEGVQFAHHNPWVVSGGKYCITSQCEHPELAARWIDWFYTEEGLLLQKYGREGKEWYHPAPDSGEMGHGEGLGPMPARFNWMPGVTWTGVTKVQNITLVQQGPIYEKREFRGAWTMNPDAPLETRLVEATDRYVGLEPEAVYPPVMLTQEETDEMRHLETQLNDLINESFARFITGDLSIDRGWDSYVKGLQDMGLDRYLEIRQAAYDRFLAS
jgi:putative aldouronate transport system substrate-binding protein